MNLCWLSSSRILNVESSSSLMEGNVGLWTLASTGSSWTVLNMQTTTAAAIKFATHFTAAKLSRVMWCWCGYLSGARCILLRPNSAESLEKLLSIENQRLADCVTMLTSAEILHFASAAVAVDSSHMTVSSSASWSRFNPPSNFVNGHVSTMCFIVCRWPQSQKGDWAGETPFLHDSTTWDLTCPETVHQRPCLTRKIKTCCRIVGSVTTVWMTTEADDQSSLHCVIVSTDVTYDHIGRWDASRGGGCSKRSAHTSQL